MSERAGWAALVAAAEHFRVASGADVVLLAAWAGPGGVAYAHHGAGPLGAAARRYLRDIVAAHRLFLMDEDSPGAEEEPEESEPESPDDAAVEDEEARGGVPGGVPPCARSLPVSVPTWGGRPGDGDGDGTRSSDEGPRQG
ncbi:LOW QUALITY PROTEIN: proline-rich AKT1 substrate 1 [Eudromia elegans]